MPHTGPNVLAALLKSLSALFPRKRVRDLECELKSLREEKAGLLEHYHLLTGNIAAAVVIRDAAQRISYCSPYTEVLTGYAVAEIYQSSDDFFLTIVHPDDREVYSRALRVIAAGEPFQFRYRFLHKSGLEMWAETRTVPVTHGGGEVLFSLSVTLDVTGTVRYQKQVEEKNRDLRDFTYMVSHDLKAPIFTIKGMLSMIQEDHPKGLDGELKEALGHIAQATDKLDLLVKSVIEYSRVSGTEIKTENVNLNQVLAEIAAENQSELEKLGARCEINPELPSVKGERVRLYQVFSNLFSNAIKYRSQKRPLEIKIFKRPMQVLKSIEICVQDNGLGIPAAQLAQIFRPFHRAHVGAAEGSGIGLACAKRLSEKLGGDLKVESVEGQGSTFVVTLRLE